MLVSFCCVLSLSLSRVINAGKSTLNEDQACCEVLVVKRRPAGSSTPNRTPTSRRRSSLPNGEGLGVRECPVSQTNVSGSTCMQTRFMTIGRDEFKPERKMRI